MKDHKENAESLHTFMRTMALMHEKMRDSELQAGYDYFCNEEYVLQHGNFWTPCPLGGRADRGQERMCFYNAQMLAICYPFKFTYVEGYALAIIPVLHAWCLDTDGRVVDATWPDDMGLAYAGVKIPTDVVRSRQLAHGVADSVLDNWQDHWPHLQGRPFE